MRKKLTLDTVKKEFEEKGYTLISDVYIKSNQSFDYICPRGHEGSMRIDHLRRGVVCPVCSGNKKLTLEFVRRSFEKKGYTLVSKEYINSHTKLDYICPIGHKGSMNWGNWREGGKCSVCFGNHKPPFKKVKDSFEAEGYMLLSKIYVNKNTKLLSICPKGSLYSVTWENWNRNGSRCPKCNKVGISKDELKLQAYIKTFNNGDIIFNDRKTIAPYELDIVIPSKKIAVEYCGLYWHSEKFKKGKNYHLNKLNLCKQAGYRLITVFEDEWVTKTDIVKSKLATILSSGTMKKVQASKCNIKELSFKEAKLFFDTYHLGGHSVNSVYLGLFYNQKLVAGMTFAKSSINKGSKNKWELSRFCVRSNYSIVGAASKLLKHFENNYNWESIFSYVDLRWSVGNLYNALGFVYNYKTSPNYWYFKNNKKRLHSSLLSQIEKDSKNIIERRTRRSQKWNRIWDCGNLKFSKVN